jgi:hypothetical protein
MSLHRPAGYGLVAVLAFSVLLTACGGSAQKIVTSSPQSPPPAPASAPRASASALTAHPAGGGSAAAANATAALTTTGWIAGFKIAVSQATVDRASQSLTLDVLVTNTAQRDGGLNAVSGELLLDPGDQTGLVGVSSIKPGTDIVAGSTAHGTLTFDVSPRFSLDAAQLVLGKPANHQWLVPLQSGRPATGPAPVDLQPPATLRTASSVYFQITSAQLLPWSCSGITPFTAYVPFDKHTSVVAITGTVGAGKLTSYAATIESVAITAPDGTTATSTTAPLKTWTSNQSLPNIRQCLPVPADAHGQFTITISDQQHSTATAQITIP